MLEITTQTPLLIFSNLILVILIYMVLNKALIAPDYTVSSSNRKWGIFLLLTFCMFSFWGADWFGYISAYQLVLDYGYEHTHLENVYVWIIQNLCHDYLMFRFIVWGGALTLLLLTLKKLSIPFDLSLLIFGIAWLPTFSYARVSLALAMMFYGTIILCNSAGKNIRFIIGFAIIACSVFFHKTAMFGVAIIFLSFLSIRFKKIIPRAAVFLFPLLVIMVQSGILGFMSADFTNNETEVYNFANYGQQYLTEDVRSSGIGTLIQLILSRLPFYMLAFVAYKMCVNSVEYVIPKDIRVFMYILLYIVVFSSIFAFDMNVNTTVVYNRFLKFAAIPATIVLTYLYNNHLFPSLSKWTLRIATMGAVYGIIYMMYNAIVG